MRTFGAYWEMGNGSASTLLLRNRDHQNAAIANITLFSSAGKPQGSIPVQIGPGATKRMDLADVVKPQGNSIQSGGLVVDSTAMLSGQLQIERPRSGINLGLQGGYRYDTENALYAPWWLPDQGSDGTIAFFNSTSEAITVTPSIVAGGSEQISTAVNLAPYASATLQLRHLVGGNRSLGGNATGMVILRYSGPSHALLPAFWLGNPNTGFSLSPEFHALHQQVVPQPVTWQFPQVSLMPETVSGTQPAAPLTAYALLGNGTRSSLTPELVAFYAPTGAKKPKKVSLPVAPLLPSETRLVNLSQLLMNASVPGGLSQFALVLTHGGSPGDLAMSVFSATPANDLVLRSEGTTQTAGVVDVSYWQMHAQPVLPRVLNRNKIAAQAQVTMYYQTAMGLESYWLPVMAVPARKSQALGLHGVMNAGMADVVGSKVPAGISSGLVTLTVANGIAGSSLPAESGPLCQTDCNAEPVEPANASPMEKSAPAPSPQVSAAAPGIQFNSSSCPPIISDISPSSGDLGATIDVIITGENFEDGDEVSVTGGITADIPAVSPDGTQMETTFTIDSSATPGDQTVTVIGPAGESNGITFTVNTPPSPILESVDPNNGTAGTQVQVLIDLSSRAPWRDGDTINVTGGITASVDSVSSDGVQVNATFTIPICNAVGQQQVTISDAFGQTSDSATFTVNAPSATPALTGVNPSTLDAGTTTTLTITGTNLNQSCSLFVTSTDGNISFGPVTFTDETGTAIKVDATVDPKDPGGQFNLAVNFNFISGTSPVHGVPVAKPPTTFRGAVPTGKATGPHSSAGPQKGATRKGAIAPAPRLTSGGGGGTNSLNITVTPIPAPVPVILYFGKAITPSGDGSCTSGNASHCGAVGQKVSLSSQVNSNLFISTQSWSIQGTAIAGFTAPAAPNYAGGEQVSQLLIFSNPSISFYWITTGGSSPASYQVKYSYCLINNQCNSATATFSVEGPIPPGNGDAVVTKTFPAFIRIAHGGEFMGIGIGIVPGIEFRADNFTIPNDNQGSFQWVQVIDTDKITTWQPPGTKSSCSPFDPQGGTPQLDNSYPYGNGFPGTVTTDCPQCVPNNRATDSPGSSLAFLNGETQHIFSATMYLEWTPNKDSACTTGNDCTIPVPMGNIPWKWEGDAINTKQTQGNTTTWSFASGCPKPGTVENPKFTKPNISFPNFGYVTWNGKTQNNTCR